MAEKRMSLGRHYVHGLRAAVRQNAQAYAFSIMITSAFGAISAYEESPSLGEVYCFMSGAVLGFVAVLAAASRGFRKAPTDAEGTKVLVLASALALGSTAAGLGAATGMAALFGGYLDWGLAPLAASSAFMLVLAFEFALAEEVEED